MTAWRSYAAWFTQPRRTRCNGVDADQVCCKMSALGQRRKGRHAHVMSVLPLKAAIRQRERHVRYVPFADIRVLGLTEPERKDCRGAALLSRTASDAGGIRASDEKRAPAKPTPLRLVIWFYVRCQPCIADRPAGTPPLELDVRRAHSKGPLSGQQRTSRAQGHRTVRLSVSSTKRPYQVHRWIRACTHKTDSQMLTQMRRPTSVLGGKANVSAVPICPPSREKPHSFGFCAFFQAVVAASIIFW